MIGPKSASVNVLTNIKYLGQKYHLEWIGVDRHCRRSRRASRAQRALLPRQWLGRRRRRGRICTSVSHAVSYRWSCAGTLCATPQARQAPSLTKLLFQIGENMAYSDNTCPHCGTTMDREWLWMIWRHCRGQKHWHHGQWVSPLDDKIWLKALNVGTIPLLLLSHHKRAALKVHKSIGDEIRNISTY